MIDVLDHDLTHEQPHLLLGFVQRLGGGSEISLGVGGFGVAVAIVHGLDATFQSGQLADQVGADLAEPLDERQEGFLQTFPQRLHHRLELVPGGRLAFLVGFEGGHQLVALGQPHRLTEVLDGEVERPRLVLVHLQGTFDDGVVDLGQRVVDRFGGGDLAHRRLHLLGGRSQADRVVAIQQARDIDRIVHNHHTGGRHLFTLHG